MNFLRQIGNSLSDFYSESSDPGLVPLHEIEARRNGAITQDELVYRIFNRLYPGDPEVTDDKVREVQRAYRESIAYYADRDAEKLAGRDVITRGKASFASTPEGKAEIYQKADYDVEPTAQGLMETTPRGRVPVDPGGFDFPGDVADFAGDIPPAVAGAIGGVLGSGLGLPGAITGSAAGEAIGEGASQYAGSLFGSEEGPAWGDVAEAAITGAVAEPVGRVLKWGANKALAPFKGALTDQLNRSVIGAANYFDNAFGTNLKDALPLSARTLHTGALALEQKVSESPFSVEQYRRQVVDPYEKETQKVFGKIEEQIEHPDVPIRPGDLERPVPDSDLYDPGQAVGPDALRKSTTDAAAGERVLHADVEAQQSRIKQVDAAFAELNKNIAPNAEVVPVESGKALEIIAERTAFANEKFGISSSTRNKFKTLLSDVAQIETYKDLDDYRKVVGSMLGTDEVLDPHLRHLYSALLTDAENWLVQGGKLTAEQAETAAARRATAEVVEEVPGEPTGILDQYGGEILRDPPLAADLTPKLDINWQDRDAVEKFVRESDDPQEVVEHIRNAVSEGDISERAATYYEDLANVRASDALDADAPERKTFLAKLGESQRDLSEGEKGLPELAVQTRAKAGDEIGLRKTSYNLRDDVKHEKIVPDIMSGNRTSSEILQLRKRIGVDPTDTGLTGVAAGPSAWNAVQAEVIESLRQASVMRGREPGIDLQTGKVVTQGGLSGDRMLTAIGRMGGPEKLEIIFGKELGDQIFAFATFLRDANAAERGFANVSRSGASLQFAQNMARLFISPLIFFAERAGWKGLGEAVMKPGGRSWLTAGELPIFGGIPTQGPVGQGILSTFSQLGTRLGAGEGVEAAGDWRDKRKQPNALGK